MNSHHTETSRRRLSRVGIVGAALAATALTASMTVAQTASPTPGTSAAPAATTTPGQPWTGHQPGRGGMPGMGGPNGGRRGDGGPGRHLPGDLGGRGGFGGGFFGGQRGWPGAGLLRPDITVTAVDGTTVSLKTADGWTRDVDTSNVVITQDGATAALTDVSVGDTVRLDETRNADGSYTVTGIEIVLPRVLGWVATLAADGFTLRQPDGSIFTVSVSDATTWMLPGAATRGLAGLSTGDVVLVQGRLGTDGTMAATTVMGGRWGDPMRRWPNGGAAPQAPEANPAPGASPAQNG